MPIFPCEKFQKLSYIIKGLNFLLIWRWITMQEIIQTNGLIHFRNLEMTQEIIKSHVGNSIKDDKINLKICRKSAESSLR